MARALLGLLALFCFRYTVLPVVAQGVPPAGAAPPAGATQSSSNDNVIILSAGPLEQVPVNLDDFIIALKEDPVAFIVGLGDLIEMIVGFEGVKSLGLTEPQKEELFSSIRKVLQQLEIRAKPVMANLQLTSLQKQQIESGMDRLRHHADISELDLDLSNLEKILTKSA